MAQSRNNNALVNALTNTLFNTKKNNQGTLYVDSGQGKELAHLNDQAFNPPQSMAGILPKAEIMQGTNPLNGQPSDDFDQYGLPLTEDGYAMMSIYNDIAKANGIPTQDFGQQNNETPVNNIQGQQSNQQTTTPAQILTGGIQQQGIKQSQPQSQFKEPTGLKSGIHDFLAGFNNNYNNSITEGNFYGDTQDEYGRTIGANKMGRAGEVVGSMGRAMQNPLIQGLVATLIAKKVNPMNDIGKAAEFGFNVANQAGQSQVNKDILAQMGYPVDTTGIFNKVPDSIIKAVYQDAYNKGRVKNQQTSNQNRKEHWERQDATDEKRLDLQKYGIDKRYQAQLENIKAKIQLGTASIGEKQEYHKALLALKKAGIDLGYDRFDYKMKKDYQKMINNGELIKVMDLKTNKVGYISPNEFNKTEFKRLK